MDDTTFYRPTQNKVISAPVGSWLGVMKWKRESQRQDT